MRAEQRRDDWLDDASKSKSFTDSKYSMESHFCNDFEIIDYRKTARLTNPDHVVNHNFRSSTMGK